MGDEIANVKRRYRDIQSPIKVYFTNISETYNSTNLNSIVSGSVMLSQNWNSQNLKIEKEIPDRYH